MVDYILYMSSTTSYKFEEDAQVAFRSILHLSANYRALQEKVEIQEQTIRELTEQLKFAENTPVSVTKVCISNFHQDVSNNKVAPENLDIINEPTTIGPLECKTLNPTTIMNR